jgi:hypothetical protein
MVVAKDFGLAEVSSSCIRNAIQSQEKEIA